MPLINPGSDTKKKLRLKIHNSKHPLPLLRHQLFASAFEIVLFCEIFVFFNSVKIDLSAWNTAQIWQNLSSINETPHEPHQIANSIVENIKRNASVHAKLHFHTTSRFSRAKKNTSTSDPYYSQPPSLFLLTQLFRSTFESVSLIFFFEICLSYFVWFSFFSIQRKSINPPGISLKSGKT